MRGNKLVPVLVIGLILVGGALLFRKYAPTPSERASTSSRPSTAVAPASTAPPERQAQSQLATVGMQIEMKVAQDPKNASLRMEAAKAYLRLGADHLALPHIEAATKLQPKDAVTWIALGDTATIANKLSLAESAYARAEALSPGNPFVYRGRGQVAVRRTNLVEAQRVFQAGLKRHPEDVELRTALGNVLVLIGDGNRARAVLAPALAKEPDRADLHFLMGRALEQLHQLKNAAAEMEKATEIDPNRDDAWGRLGLYRAKLTEYESARGPLETAIRLNPREPHYFWALAETYSLDVKSKEGIPRALELYHQALQLDPVNVNALTSLMFTLTRRGEPADLEESVGLLKRLITINPKGANAYFKLAEVYRKLGKTVEAQQASQKFESLSKGLRHVPQAPDALALGQAAMKRGEYGEAASRFQAALQADPSSIVARTGMEEASKKLAEKQK
jgi:tetratricopeptide (TPR) repeat protein